MTTWQKGLLTTLAVITIGVVSFGFYLVYVNEASLQTPIPANVKPSNPTPRPSNTPLPPCDKLTASAWIDRTHIRQTASNNDMDILIAMQSPNPDVFISLASRAKDRYNQQRLEQTPSCLSEFQTLVVDAFYYNWLAYEALTKGEWDKAALYMEIMADKLEIAEAIGNAAIELAE